MPEKRFTIANDIKKICVAIAKKYPSQYPYFEADRIHFWWDESPREATKFAYVRKMNALDKASDPEHDHHFVVIRHAVEEFSEAQLIALCGHEMKHPGPRDVDKEGHDKIKIVTHDVEEFYSLGKAVGFDWTFNPHCPNLLKDDVEFGYMPTREPKENEKAEKTSLKVAAKNR